MGLEGRRSLFISYNGMLEPLGQTQVMPYLRELAKVGLKVSLLSFEKPTAYTVEGRQKCDELKKRLGSQGIEWHWLPYHQTPSLPATAYDVFAGIRYARHLVRKNQVEVVHARGHIPATIALSLKKHLRTKMIFDLRGLMADEYVDAEHWKKESLAYRITKAAERRIFSKADAIVTLTERIWPIIREWDGLKGRTIPHSVIPCCVDLDLFKFSAEDRDLRRRELGLTDQLTLVYSGSLDGWYLTDRMADFFKRFLYRQPNGHIIWLTPGNHERVKQLMSDRGIAPTNYSIRSVGAATVPSYLSAADAGVAFIKPCLSKLASSPTKNGEYLAAGLPLIINAGVGDSDSLVNDWKAGVLLSELNEVDYDKAIDSIVTMASTAGIKSKVRQLAEKLFDLETIGARRYTALYETVLLNN
jgi:glycosyltransferase involved in cell wall biosynthesis